MKTNALVVSRYNENVFDWIQSVSLADCETFIYNKGISDKAYSLELENVGRESHTYLYFILNHYKSLPENIMFLQGDAPDHLLQEEWKNISNGLFEWKSYKGMGHHTFSVTGTSIPAHVKQEFPIYRKTPDYLFNKILNQDSNKIANVSYSMNAEACFCVAKRNILRHPKTVYEKLYNEHYNNIHEQRPGSIVQYAGTMEYSWHLIFDDIFYQNS